MRKTALILAGAAAFDLGVMAVSAQARQGTREPTAPAGPPAASQARAVDMFIKIGGVNSVQACTARRGEVVRHEGVQQCRIPAEAAGSASSPPGRPPADPAPRGRIRSELSTMEVETFVKIDAVDTVQACTARRGEVVRHEGVQQCRLPGPAGSPDLRNAREDVDIHKQGLALNFTKIDIHYTARACIAQRGEVITRDGIQQCALSAGPGNDRLPPGQR